MHGYRATNSLFWVLVAISLILRQLFVYGSLNDQVASILPSDGCDQILNIDLKNRLDILCCLTATSAEA